MFRASALSITPPARFFRPFSTSKSFHSGSASRQEQQRQSLDGSRTPADGSEPEVGLNEQVQEGVDGLASARDPSRTADVQVPSQDRSTVPSHEPSSGVDTSQPGDDSPRRAVPPPNLEDIKQRLREWSEQTAVVIRNRADDFTARSKTTFSQLGAHLNKVTGYEEIEALKRQVVEQGALILSYDSTFYDTQIHYEQRKKLPQPVRPREMPN